MYRGIEKGKGRVGRNGRRGFTLVELVIVGALIALFSSLAVFGVQQQFRSNLRKATIGETRNIAAALDFANLDTSIFPKLCWLIESREGMELIGQQITGNPDQGRLVPFLLLDNNDRRNNLQFPADLSVLSALANRWNGPYFAMSQARANVAQGRGGFVYMLLPGFNNGPNDPNAAGGLRWPADPYSNPYVVYMMDLDMSTTTPRLQFVNQDGRNGQDPTRKGNYVNAVVSYGPNHYPGGDEFDRPAFGGSGSADAAAIGDPGTGVYALRLYKGMPNYRPDSKGVITHSLIGSAEYNFERAAVWSFDFHGVRSTFGVTDLGSDDVVFEF